MHLFRQLHTTVSLLKTYNGVETFHTYLKKYFSINKKHGSNDRKNISALCYAYFRLGKSFNQKSTEDRIIIGLLLGSNKKLLSVLKPEWEQFCEWSVEQKISMIDPSEKVINIFPFANEITEDINCSEYAFSILTQPDLFIRIRPGYEDQVDHKLELANIPFKKDSNFSVRLLNNTKLDHILQIGKEVIIQDYNSQNIRTLFYPFEKVESDNRPFKIWDCCAASGGKSILAFDVNPNIDLTVSDIRSSIIENLKQRFELAGIKKYTSFISDLTKSDHKAKGEDVRADKNKFDFIIADVPCTGSGTWARTPENLFYFNKSQLKKYVELQKAIIKNSLDRLSPKGYYLFITCSVFKEENEQQVAFIKSTKKLNLETVKLFKGYDLKADTMFAALFRSIS